MLGNDQLASMAASGADQAALMQQMIADASAADPRMAMVAQLLAGQQAAAAVSPGDDLLDEVATLTGRLVEAEATIEAMKRDGRRLIQSHQACRARLTDLAAALGACGLCWGEQPSCPSCRGRGRPGMVRPDMELRARLLGPRRKPTAPDHSDPEIC